VFNGQPHWHGNSWVVRKATLKYLKIGRHNQTWAEKAQEASGIKKSEGNSSRPPQFWEAFWISSKGISCKWDHSLGLSKPWTSLTWWNLGDDHARKLVARCPCYIDENREIDTIWIDPKEFDWKSSLISTTIANLTNLAISNSWDKERSDYQICNGREMVDKWVFNCGWIVPLVVVVCSWPRMMAARKESRRYDS
jgi:hypothetical protein